MLTKFLGGRRGTGVATIAELRRPVHRQPAELRVHHDLRAADHRLRLLLQLDRLRPDPPGRPDPSPGWLHPRRPPRSADRALPRQGRQPHHAARAPCSSRSSRSCRTSCCGSPTCRRFPFAGTTRAHRGGRGTRVDAPDRQPADAAQLRGIPRSRSAVRDPRRPAHHPRATGCRQGHAVRATVTALRRSAHLHR